MLFRPANVGLFPFDRIAFLLLVFVVLIRILLLQGELPVSVSFTIPMLGLAVLALVGNWKQPYDAEAWSVVAAQFLVPFAMFHVARAVFTTDTTVRQLEAFCLLTLAYLCFISIAFLLGQTQLIFPRFILDGAVDMHVDRARGPFLQAVANGVSINVLGLVAFDVYRRKRLPRIMACALFLGVPTAILATMTRSVWFSFVLSFCAIAFVSKGARLRQCLLLVGMAVGIIVTVACANLVVGTASQERFQDRDTLNFRLAVYELGWDMFREKPLLGWGQGEFAREVEARMSDFRPNAYAAHNTFVDITVEHGAVGLSLYLWIAVSLFQLRKTSKWLPSIWPLCLGVYFLNACCVVMNYQFVNALLFTFAGVMAAQRRGHAERLPVNA